MSERRSRICSGRIRAPPSIWPFGSWATRTRPSTSPGVPGSPCRAESHQAVAPRSIGNQCQPWPQFTGPHTEKERKSALGTRRAGRTKRSSKRGDTFCALQTRPLAGRSPSSGCRRARAQGRRSAMASLSFFSHPAAEMYRHPGPVGDATLPSLSRPSFSERPAVITRQSKMKRQLHSSADIMTSWRSRPDCGSRASIEQTEVTDKASRPWPPSASLRTRIRNLAD